MPRPLVLSAANRKITWAAFLVPLNPTAWALSACHWVAVRPFSGAFAPGASTAAHARTRSPLVFRAPPSPRADRAFRGRPGPSSTSSQTWRFAVPV